MPSNRTVLSLFSSAGIGELGVEAAGLSILVNNELVPNRCAIYQENHLKTHTICGDIWEKEDEILSAWRERSAENPFLVYTTPPCQGMSSNGAGKLLSEIRQGNRHPEDPRNRLILPTMHIVKALRPVWLLLENVPTMGNTVIRDKDGIPIRILDYIQRELGDEYCGAASVVNCADYGIPQTRRRLITLFTRSERGRTYWNTHGTFLPPITHSEVPTASTKKWVSLRDSIGDLPPLDARKGRNARRDVHPWHFVPVMRDEKYWWMEHTPEGCTAYNNQWVNPKCGFQGNRLHGSQVERGHHTANRDTPIYCERCGSLLPRPTLVDKATGERRLLNGYDTAYRRMEWDVPAPTLTQNLYEALILQTITEYSFSLTIQGKYISKNLCAEIIGESVPPRLIEMICRHIVSISNDA